MTKQKEIERAATDVEECKAKLEEYRANGRPSWRIKSQEEELEWLEKALEMVKTHSYYDARARAKHSVRKQRQTYLQLKYLWENCESLADIPKDLRWVVVQTRVSRDEKRRLAGVAGEMLQELREEMIANPPDDAGEYQDLMCRITSIEGLIRLYNQQADEYDQFARWYVEYGEETAEDMIFELHYPNHPRE
jgi:hypothetical protein